MDNMPIDHANHYPYSQADERVPENRGQLDTSAFTASDGRPDDIVPQYPSRFQVFFRKPTEDDNRLNWDSLGYITSAVNEVYCHESGCNQLTLKLYETTTGLVSKLRDHINIYCSDDTPLTIAVCHYDFDGAPTFDDEYDVDLVKNYFGPTYEYNVSNDPLAYKCTEPIMPPPGLTYVCAVPTGITYGADTSDCKNMQQLNTASLGTLCKLATVKMTLNIVNHRCKYHSKE